VGETTGGPQELTQEAQRPFSSQPSSRIFPVAQSWVAQTGSLRPLRAEGTGDPEPDAAGRSGDERNSATQALVLGGRPLEGDFWSHDFASMLR